MSKPVKETMSYDATCDEVFTMFRDPAYVEAKLAGTGGSDTVVSVEEEGSDVIINAARTLPAKVPAFVKSITGDTIRAVESDRWSPADDLGARTAAVVIDFEGLPAGVTGTLSLHPVGEGSAIDVDLAVKASVPLIGGKIEEVIADQVGRGVRQENKIGVAWLAEH